MQIDIRDVYSPSVLKKMVYVGTNAVSYEQASQHLAALAELSIGAKQIQRWTHRIGGDLVEQSVREVEQFEKLPLVEKERSPLRHPPQVAVVQMDGGRYQRRPDSLDLEPEDEERRDAGKKGHWREDKIGLLATMTSKASDHDPCPQIPEVFHDRQAVEKLAREVGHVSVESPPSSPAPEDEPLATLLTEPLVTAPSPATEVEVKYEPPKLLVRTMVATARPIRWFEKLLVQAAWARGFAGAARKAFVADGAACNWKVWRNYFSTYTPILDFIHALGYAYLGATTRSAGKAWKTYSRWIQWIWSGEVALVIAELRQAQQTLGDPGPDEPRTSPRTHLATVLEYLKNNQSRMRYDQYRRQGLPITSCHIESTVKLFNKRIKGTEKFWSGKGAEAILALKAAYLDETGAMETFWRRRYSRSSPASPTATAA